MKDIKNFKNVLNMLCIANRTFIYLFFIFFFCNIEICLLANKHSYTTLVFCFVFLVIFF